MTTRLYSSTSQETTLTSALAAGSGATTMVVASSTALLAGKAPANTTPKETFTVVIDPDTALEEIVDVIYPSSGSSTTLTVVRGVDGTGAIAHSAGAKVRHMGIGRDFREANDHSEQTTGTVHGVALNTLVKTTDTGTVTSTMILDGTIATADIADSAVTSAKIADGTIATGDIADSAITGAKIATGAVGTVKIDDAAVTEVKIGTSAVTTTKVADSAITSAKIADGTIVAGDIADGAITSAKILNDTIVNADINTAAAIDKTKISGTAITAADTGTVTSTMIADGTIVNADVSATAAIAKTKLNLGGTITSADLVDGTIVAADIADGTITAAKMVADPYARTNHTGTQTASTISDFSTAVQTNRLDQMAAPTNPVSLNSQKITSLATPTSNADAATKLYVDTKVADLVNSAPSTLDTLGEIATAISSGGSVVSALVSKAGDTMTGPLTLSGAPSSNLHAATKAYVDSVAGSTAAAEAAAAAAAASYDSFDDRYLGSKSSAPTLDNDGNALIVGAIYWNSVDNAMYVWKGSSWGSISSTADIFRYRFDASGGETTLSGLDSNGVTLSYLPGKEQVYLNGILLVRTTDYTASTGTSITSLAALTAGDIVEIITFTAFDLATTINKTLFDAKGDILVATAADVPGKLPVGTNGQFLKADSTTSTGLAWGEVAGALAQPTEPSSPSDGQIWIDTDGTVGSGTQITRWYKAPSSGTTVLTGPGDNSVTLQYTAGYEQVYLNGVLLVRGTDYTATDGGTVTLASATVTGDTVEVIGVVAVGVTDVYTQSQSDAKYVPKNLTTTTGDIIYASAANTPARLGIGSSGQFLSVNSGVPSWVAAPAATKNYTLLNTGGTALNAATTTVISGISGVDDIFIIIQGAYHNASGYQINVGFNGGTASRNWAGDYWDYSSVGSGYFKDGQGASSSSTTIPLTYTGTVADKYSYGWVKISGCNTAGYKIYQSWGGTYQSANSNERNYNQMGSITLASTISSIEIISTTQLQNGTVYVYGAN